MVTWYFTDWRYKRVFVNGVNEMCVGYNMSCTYRSCVEFRFLKTLKFECTLTDQTKKHKHDRIVYRKKKTTELLEYWKYVVAMSIFFFFFKKAIAP